MRHWKRLSSSGAIISVECYSHNLHIDAAVEITEQEFDAFIDSLPGYQEPPPDQDAVRVAECLATSPQVITMPEIWDLLRIYAKKLGFEF